MKFIVILQALFCLTILWFVLSQIVIPLASHTPLFPLFNDKIKEVEHELDNAEEQAALEEIKEQVKNIKSQNTENKH